MTLRRLSAAAVLLLALGAAMWGTLKHYTPPNLLAKSVRVASCKGWWTDEEQYRMCIHWLSDRRVLYAAARQGDKKGCVVFKTLDTETAALSSLDELTADFAQYAGEPDYLLVSPDGKRALWQTNNCSVAEALAGGKPVVWHTRHDSTFAEILWQADSRHWVDFVNEEMSGSHLPTRLITYDTASPLSSVTEPFAEDVGLIDPVGIDRKSGDLIMMTSDDVVDEVGSSARRLTRFHAGISLTKVRDIAYYGAADTGRQLAAISPDGARIAWIEIHEKPELDPESWFSKLFHRFFKCKKYQSLLELHISNLDGSHPALLGSIETNEERIFDEKIRCLTFLPDSKKLSYVYDHVLYTIAAP